MGILRRSRELREGIGGAVVAGALVVRAMWGDRIVETLAALDTVVPVNFGVGVLLIGGIWAVVALVTLRERQPERAVLWLWGAVVLQVAVMMLVFPLRRAEGYSDALDARVPGLVPGMLTGAVPVLLSGIRMRADQGYRQRMVRVMTGGDSAATG